MSQNKLIDDLYRGEAYNIDVQFRHVPTGQHIVSAILTIKRNATDADADALYQRRITITPDIDGCAIRDSGAAARANGYGWAKLHWLLLESLTATFPVGPDLPYDVWVRSSAGRNRPVESGVIRAQQQITQATS